jgi:hypothetical protein
VRQPGDRVNIEVDVIAKYVERLVSGYLPGPVGLAQPEAAGASERGGARSW